MTKKKLFIEKKTIKDIFNESVIKYNKKVFLAYPNYTGVDKNKYYSFEEVKKLLLSYIKYYKTIGLNYADRVGIIVGNIPEFFIIKLSLNYMGISCVPINYELKASEIKYIITHSNSKIVISNRLYLENIKKIIFSIKGIVGISLYENNNFITIRAVSRKIRRSTIKVTPFTEASLLYTSGTTGKPKACVLTHFYEINTGYSYTLKKGLVTIKPGKERIFNCLPVHHVNSGIFSFYASLITGNCQIQAERFSASRFWKEIKYSDATIFHYLGIMVPVLLKRRKLKIEKDNNLRLGVGAGIEPNLHKKFEKRFKIPMVELWGMTEMVRCIFNNKKNRKIGDRCFGKPDKSLEVKVINNNGKKVINEEGELLIRHNYKEPTKGFFSGYYKNKRETRKVWKNKWFYTGDIVKEDKYGYLYFIDRKKNIIRRSGENISSAEIEATLLSLSVVSNCAVTAYPHKIYDEEVLAFIITENKKNENIKTAKKILSELQKKVAYFKLPGYIQFTNTLPVTSTQKIMKNELINKLQKENKSKFFDVTDYKKTFKLININFN